MRRPNWNHLNIVLNDILLYTKNGTDIIVICKNKTGKNENVKCLNLKTQKESKYFENYIWYLQKMLV